MSTFQITPKDVGRKAVTRGGKIGNVAQSPHFSEKYPYAYQIRFDGGSYYGITEFGKYRIDSGVPELDVVAWLDEPIATPRPKDLRDEFAMVALQGVLGSSLYDEARSIQAHNAGSSIEGIVAHLSYEFADAMMKVREGKV